MLDKLEAVNLLLSAIGEDRVSSLDSGLDEAEHAEAALDAMTKEHQSRGWSFNTDKDIKTVPDFDGYFQIPDDYLSVDTSYLSVDTEVVVRRNGNQRQLFDVANQTFVFTKDLYLQIVRLLPFEDMPYAHQQYVARTAAVDYQQSELGSMAVDAMLMNKAEIAKAAMEQYEIDHEDYNILRHNPERSYITRRGGYRRV